MTDDLFEKNDPASVDEHIRMARVYVAKAVALEMAPSYQPSITEAATLATMHATCALMEAELLKDYTRD